MTPQKVKSKCQALFLVAAGSATTGKGVWFIWLIAVLHRILAVAHSVAQFAAEAAQIRLNHGTRT